MVNANSPACADQSAALNSLKEKLQAGVRLLNINEAAAYLNLSPKTLRNRTHRKSTNPFPVKVKRIGGRVLFDRLDLDSFVDNLA